MGVWVCFVGDFESEVEFGLDFLGGGGLECGFAACGRRGFVEYGRMRWEDGHPEIEICRRIWGRSRGV